jgi:hypothetical protein
MIRRRDFNKAGILFITGLGVGNLGFSFVPGGSFDDGPFKNTIAFRKPPRKIKEEVSGFLWADAADFGDYGGWALDTQFVGFMGSSYLIAHGTGTPVAAARLEIPAVRTGRYRLWVRSKNWIPEHSPGRFALSINGRDCGKEFGAQHADGWRWEDGGMHDLSSGQTLLELRDLTGYYGRCSSIILTRDLKYVPPAELDAFRKERARLTGVSDVPVNAGEYDVVVVGAGTAGCNAAIAAARMGAKTVLISDRPVVGGNASVELGVPVVGAHAFHESARETGIIEEAYLLALARGWGLGMTRPFADLIAAEPNLTLVENHFLEGVEKNGNVNIRSAVVRDTLTGARKTVPGKLFVDTTGDGWLGYHAGADYRIGREARSEFNESLAPEAADNITMSGCLRAPHESFKWCIFLRTKQDGSTKPYDPPAWIYQNMPPFNAWRKGRGDDDRLERVARSGHWWLEHHGAIDDLNDPEGARDELFRVYFTTFHYLKTQWPAKERIANYELDYVPFSLAKRETRRLMGDYVLNQNDCMTARHFEDAIGHIGWNLDVHAADGIFSTTGPFCSHDHIPVGEIPYRCLYSKNIENLMMAGRNVSVTHYALGTVRVQGTTSLMGQAAGTAAALALHHGILPRGVYQHHRRQLQQTLLKQDQFIPKVLNADPADLARTASVSASSHEADNIPANVTNGIARPWPDQSNVWRSAEGQALPQWIELVLEKPMPVSMVQCVFDTALSEDMTKRRVPCSPGCIRNYRIEVLVNEEWRTVVLEKKNFQRFRRHVFTPVTTDRIRLTAESVEGGGAACIHELRVYDRHEPFAAG